MCKRFTSSLVEIDNNQMTEGIFWDDLLHYLFLKIKAEGTLSSDNCHENVGFDPDFK